MGVDRQYTTTVIAAVLVGVTTLAVFLRCYTRHFIQKRFSVDDYLILLSWASFCAFMFSVLQETKYGIGKHLIDVYMNNPGDLVMALKYWWTAQILFLFATCTVKISVAVFFCSLCPPYKLHVTAVTMAYLSVATGLATMLFQIFNCKPVSYAWERANPGVKGSCVGPHAGFIAIQIVNTFDIFTDVVLALLPCIMVWNMVMARIKKFGVSILLGLGGLSAIAAIIRACYFKVSIHNRDDFTYFAWPIVVTSSFEPAIAISVVCFAHLRPLMKQIFPKRWFSLKEESSSDVVTFGRRGGRSDNIAEIALHAELKPGTYSQRPANWKNLP